uniref:Endoplasmic reticulum vesicle transporter C-terminal domain-containing protein n=1 Tax=Leersia perrieri TaxID=77586 RepID=A0A0D9VZU5_9ORYZ
MGQVAQRLDPGLSWDDSPLGGGDDAWGAGEVFGFGLLGFRFPPPRLRLRPRRDFSASSAAVVVAGLAVVSDEVTVRSGAASSRASSSGPPSHDFRGNYNGYVIRARAQILSYHIYCSSVLSVDAIDMSGKHEVDLHTNIWKLRLDRYGHIIGTEYLNDLVEKEHGTHDHDHDHEHHDEQKKQEHTFNEDAEKMVKSVKQAMENGEGCRVYGVLDVQRVAGNFHISVHGLNIFVAEKIFDGSSHVNVSHVIHDLSFGPKYPGLHNPLDDTTRILHDTSGTFKYYIKIVPTEYRYLSKQVLPTNQFSVTEYFVPKRSTDRNAWPAVYFLYDLSPITVTIKEERRNFLHFLTRLCAVLGGTFAMTGMLDRWMYRIIESVTNPKTRSTLR